MAANLRETLEEEDADGDGSETMVSSSSSNITSKNSDRVDVNRQANEVQGERNPLLELKKCKEWLQQQKVDHEAELLARRLQQAEDLQPSSSESSQSDLYDRISKLQDQLYSLSTARSYKKLVLDRALCGDHLMKKLFPDIVTDSPTERDIEVMRYFANLCETQNNLSSEILAEHEALMKTQMALDKLKKDSYEIKTKNRGLMAYLQKLKEEKEEASTSVTDSSTIQQLKQQLSHSIEKVEIVRNVFQSLIAGSGVDWASNEEMRSLVLSLGEPLTF